MKVYRGIQEKKLRTVLELRHGEEQNPNKTSGVIFAFRMMVEKVKECNKEAHNPFTEIRKADDSVSRGKLWRTIDEDHGEVGKLSKALKRMYEKCSCNVRIG